MKKIDAIIKINKTIETSFIPMHFEVCYKMLETFNKIYNDEVILKEFREKLKVQYEKYIEDEITILG